MNNRKLYVPSDVSLRNEVWAGLSVKDAITSLLVTLCAGILAAILVNVLHVPLLASVMGVLITGVFCIGLLSRMPEVNRSILDQIGIIIAFEKSQKQYHYIYRRGGNTDNGCK